MSRRLSKKIALYELYIICYMFFYADIMLYNWISHKEKTMNKNMKEERKKNYNFFYHTIFGRKK